MGILHACVLPIDEANLLAAVIPFHKKEIIRHGVDVRQHPLLHMCVNVSPEGENIFLGLPVVLINGGRTVPERLIKLDLPKDIKRMGHGEAQLMKFAQPLHAPAYILGLFRVAHPGIGEIFRNFIAVVGADVGDVIADVFLPDCLVYGGLVAAIHQLSCTLSGDAHDVALTLAGKQERAIGHAFFQNGDLGDLRHVRVQRIADGSDGLAFQVVGLAVQLPELLKGFDAHGLSGVHQPSGNDHAALIPQGLLPKDIVIPRLGVHGLQPGADGVGIRLRQIADADHGIPGRALGHGYQLPLVTNTDAAVMVEPVCDHVPGVQLLPGKGIVAAPDVAGDYIGICQVFPGQIQGVKVVFQRIFWVDDQFHTVCVH